MILSKNLIFIIFLATLISSSVAIFKSPELYKPPTSGNITAQTQYWFTSQPLDHFNSEDNRTFSQRYWVNDTYYLPEFQRVLLYICPEATCSGISDMFTVNVARDTGALLVALEHRYYGLSVPFGNESLTIPNLEFLTVAQALADLSYFVDWFNKNSEYTSLRNGGKWVCVGGSYAGGLSSWLRETYPDVIHGSWASSPVINAILEFTQFDYQIYLSANKSGPQCPAIVQNLTRYIEWNLYSNGTEWAQTFKGQFGESAEELNNEQFLYYIADYLTMQIQYGARIVLCDFFERSKNFDEMFSAFITMVTNALQPFLYNPEFYNNNTWDPNWSANKLWNYQVCTEMGWFQTAYPNSEFSMRSQNLTLSFFQSFCEQAFGAGIWPNVEQFNQNFGGKTPNNTRTILINGCEDPWQWASNTNLKDGNITSYLAECNDCAHCVDLYAPKLDTPIPVKIIHDQILWNITQWYLEAENDYIFSL